MFCPYKKYILPEKKELDYIREKVIENKYRYRILSSVSVRGTSGR